LNILFLSETLYPDGSGAELATYLYAKLLTEMGVNVVVITNSYSEHSSISRNEGFYVYRLPLSRRNRTIKYSVLARIDILLSGFMKKWMNWADIVYVPRFWYSAIPFAKAYGKPVIVHLHDYIPVCPLAKIYDVSRDTLCDSAQRGSCSPRCIYLSERHLGTLMENIESVALNSTLGRCIGKMARLSDAIVCVSKAQKELIEKCDRNFHSKIRVIYNPLPEIPQMDLKGEDFGYFGGPRRLKGFPVLHKAATLFSHSNREQIKIHVTKFSGANETLSKLLGQLGILIHERLSESSFDCMYKHIQTVIVPSVWMEPLPYVLSEAIMKGRIVIASRIGGIPEQAEGCKGVFLFEPGNSYELAEIMKNVINLERETVVDLTNSSRDVLARKFDNRRTLRNFMDLCEALIVRC
jgi:glycosyltransferase involved in cell wall biosynthesis